jgi:hypothetical protein
MFIFQHGPLDDRRMSNVFMEGQCEFYSEHQRENLISYYFINME